MDRFFKMARLMQRLLQDCSINKVYIATGKTKPPLLGNIVNFPRLALVIDGVHETAIELEGKPVEIVAKPADALFFPPNSWDKPTWAKKCSVINFLYGKKQTGISRVVSGGGIERVRAEKIAVRRPLNGPTEKILQTILEIDRTNKGFRAYRQLIEVLLSLLSKII